MLQREELQNILQFAIADGVDFGELFQEVSDNCSILFENGRVDKVSGGIDAGMGVRVIIGDHTMYAHSNLLTAKKGMELVKDCINSLHREDATTDTDDGKQKTMMHNVMLPTLEAETAHKTHPNQVSMEEKVEMFHTIDGIAREYDASVRQVTISYRESIRTVSIASTEAAPTLESRMNVRISCQVIAGEGNHLETGFASLGGCCGMELFSSDNLKTLAENAAHQAVTLLHAEPCPGGIMPVVLSSEAGGTMVHEACGHGLEADLVLRGMSVYADKVGQQVASEKVTVYDDGSIEGSYGSFAFDDEGHPSQRNILIDHGILKGYLSDRKTAKEMGMVSTGSGRRESYRYEPVTRMSNTFIASGTDRIDDILGAVDYGLFVKHMGGGQVDTLTGNYVFDVSEGYLIEHGRITRPVRGATLIGNGPESLMQIEMVGDDMGTAIGTCGKFGQGVPVGDGQPTILIRGLTVGGTVNNKQDQ